MASSGLDRDFGYLMPFLDKVAQAAESASPAVRDELRQLLAGEKQRWERARALLSSSAVSARPEPVEAPATTVRLTVGSLRRK